MFDQHDFYYGSCDAGIKSVCFLRFSYRYACKSGIVFGRVCSCVCPSVHA